MLFSVFETLASPPTIKPATKNVNLNSHNSRTLINLLDQSRTRSERKYLSRAKHWPREGNRTCGGEGRGRGRRRGRASWSGGGFRRRRPAAPSPASAPGRSCRSTATAICQSPSGGRPRPPLLHLRTYRRRSLISSSFAFNFLFLFEIENCLSVSLFFPSFLSFVWVSRRFEPFFFFFWRNRSRYCTKWS